MSKLIIDLDSTSLSSSACIRQYFWTIVGSINKQTGESEGGYTAIPDSVMVYGTAVHKFIDTMYKSGELGVARRESLRIFNMPKVSDPKKLWLDDPKHLYATCADVWMDFIQEDNAFDVLSIQQKCWSCGGKGTIPVKEKTGQELDDEGYSHHDCVKCHGTGIVEGPATEITFRIQIYEDAILIINLCGTIDRVGKFRNGPFAIRDWKNTTYWMKDEFLEGFALSKQLRIYTIACKLMAEREPTSIMGQIGRTSMGAMIDGIFIKPLANDNIYESSSIMMFTQKDLAEFREQLRRFCAKLSVHIEQNDFPREGILNGACEGRFNRCNFWNVCNAPNDIIAKNLLERDFKRRIYNPLNFNS